MDPFGISNELFKLGFKIKTKLTNGTTDYSFKDSDKFHRLVNVNKDDKISIIFPLNEPHRVLEFDTFSDFKNWFFNELGKN